jgi:hypothetical protein
MGTKESEEAIKAVFSTVRKIWEIKKEGVSGLPKLLTLYNDLEAGIRGGDQIPAEMKDLASDEIKAIIALSTTEMGLTLEAVGIKGIAPYLKLTAKAVSASEGTYMTWKPIVEEINALRNAPKE